MNYRSKVKTIIFFIILFFSTSQLMAQQSVISEAELKFDQLKWLTGTWERLDMKGERRGLEQWILKSDSLYEGEGTTTEGRDTVFVESLQIVREDSSLFYIADVPENPAPVWFEIVEAGSNYFRCENPEHDFPKSISYHLKGNELHVLVSGDDKEVEYRFQKRK